MTYHRSGSTQMAEPEGKRTGTLTKREAEVLALVAGDRSDGEVAALLCTSTQTVQSQMRSIRRKLGCGTRAGAVAKALRTGEIE